MSNHNIFKRVIRFLCYRILKKRILFSSLETATGTAERVNYLLNFTQGSNYLEVGVNLGFTFEGVKATNRVAVDPVKRIFVNKSCQFFKIESDDFFNVNENRFDLIFIDGFHEYRQVLRDIINSLNVLNEDGIVLIDDVFPTDLKLAAKPWKALTTRERRGVRNGDFSWQGDVFKAIFLLTDLYEDSLNFCTLTENSHVQMVIWKKHRFASFEIPSVELLEFYDNDELSDLLKKGVPISWGCKNLVELGAKLSG